MLKIITDSSSEITEEEARLMGIEIIPLTVVFGEKAYLEGIELSREEFYEKLKGDEFPHTACPSEEQFLSAFRRTEGEEALVILISSALSGTFACAELAKRDGNFSNIVLFDSLCTTAMMKLLVLAAWKNREKSAAEVVELLSELRPRIRLHAYVSTLEYLYKGGRLKKSAAIFGGLLGIKPLVTIGADGTVKAEGREHGNRRAVRALKKLFTEEPRDPNYPIYYLQTDNPEPAEALKEETGETGEILSICGAVGTHIGPDAAGIVYVVKA